MPTFVAIFGAVIAVLGVVGAVFPGVMKAMARYFKKPGSVYFAAAFRLVLGTLLIVAGPYCRLEYHSQQIVRLFGVLTFAAGVLLLLLGSHRLAAFIDWWMAKPTLFLRLWALVAVALGTYLMYASGAWL